MTSFAAVDRSFSRAIQDLHDYLWAGAKHDEADLLRRLTKGAVGLDRHLRAPGIVSKGVRPLAKSFDRHGVGADLFTYSYIVSGLAAAVERRKKQPREAAKRISEVVVSNSIHLASVADRFDLVETFQSGRTDFGKFQDRLAGVLEARGVLPAGELNRAANGVYDLHAIWDVGWPKDYQQVALVASIGATALHSAHFVEALRALGRYRNPPYGTLVPALRRILDRVGAHP